MRITSKVGLMDYCLRKLGHPVIEINIDETQAIERIDDAIEMWQQYHFDGSERTYMKLNVTASTLTLSSPNANAFREKEKVTGETSGATAEVYKIRNDTTIELKRVNGTFANDEIVTGNDSGATYQLAATDAFFLGSWDRQYFAVPDSVLSVVRVFPINQASFGGNTSVFNVFFQLRANETLGLIQADMTYYTMFKTYLSTLDMILPSERSFRFNRRTEKLHLDVSWYDLLTPDDIVLAEVHMITDPEVFLSAYNDMFVKRYATLLIKKQWASNLSKFDGVKLPGGVTLNGAKLYQEAMDEIEKLEDEIRITWEVPAMFQVG